MCGRRRKCINPKNGCSPKCQIRMGLKSGLQNLPQTLKNVFPQLCHSYLQKCYSGPQNDKNVTIDPKCWSNDVDKLNNMTRM